LENLDGDSLGLVEGGRTYGENRAVFDGASVGDLGERVGNDVGRNGEEGVNDVNDPAAEVLTIAANRAGL